MGIKGLWTVLAPYCEKKSLHEIQGETLAVDLSGWVCDSQNVTEYHIQPKLYLRNLFFRTIYLLLADIKPIFVLEGDAPELKRDVMAARNALQFRGAPPNLGATSNKPNVARRRFRSVLKECETLLKCMGVCCIKGRGEAEATCAVLNSQGVVNAVVSQDSDCFAYGARRVYRNFSVSSSAGGGAMQGSVDCYDADAMYRSIGFGRNKMVALALLCGCDYGVGACGSSINTVVSFLHTVPEEQAINRYVKSANPQWGRVVDYALNTLCIEEAFAQQWDMYRLVSWVSDTRQFEERVRWAALPGRCDRCGHSGRGHAKNGCPVCASHRGCHDNAHKAKLAEVKRELSLRAKALSSGVPFPEPRVMNEFLNASNEEIDLNCLKTPVPSLIQFVKLMSSKLDWSERYCVEKFLPILTKWHLRENVACRKIAPKAIKKKRNPKGVPSYEVLWEDMNGEYDGLIPDDQFEESEDISLVWTSIERQDLMRRFYPDLVEAYEESVKKPVKVKKVREKKNKENQDPNKPKRKYSKKKKTLDVDVLETVNNSLKRLSLNVTDLNSSKAQVSVCINKLKRKLKNNTKKKTTIEAYLINKNRKYSMSKAELYSFSGDENSGNIQDQNQLPVFNQDGTDAVRTNISFLNGSREDINDSELSDIVDQIVNRASAVKTANVNSNLVKLVFENNKILERRSFMKQSFIHNNCSTPMSSPLRKKKKSINVSKRFSASKINTSYFFDKLTDNCDAFEMSIENNAVMDVKCDLTVDYSLPDVYF